MSTMQTGDSQATEKAWEEIRQLIDELARLAQSPVSPQEFYVGLLDRVVAALAGAGGAVWTREGQAPLELQYQINLEQTRLAGNDEQRQTHRQLLGWVMQKNEATYIPPRAGVTEDGAQLNPSEFLLLLAPMVVEDQVVGVVEVFKAPGGLPSARKGYLRFLSQMCGLASDFFKNHQLRILRQRQSVWGEFENFTRSVHVGLDTRQTCFTLANEGRRFTEVDRVSVATRYGRSARIEAISGQDVLNKRSNTVRLLNRLVSKVVRTDDAFYYTEDTKDLPPQIERVLHEYIDESHARALAIVPLRKPRPPAKEGEAVSERRGALFGAVVFERFDRGDFDSSVRQRIDSVCEHGSVALNNSLDHSRIFLLPLWIALGKVTWLFRGRTLPKTLLVVAAIVGLAYLMVGVQYDFELEGRGTLQPEIRREVFASMDGDVVDVFVDHGDMVEANQQLVQLDNRDLTLRIDSVAGEWATAQRRLASVQALRLAATRDATKQSEVQQLATEEEDLKKNIESLSRQHQLLLKQNETLRILSPINGQVTTWKVKEQLFARPVQRGQVLMSVADLQGPWVLEVLMPEDRMGHIRAAQAKLPEGHHLQVTFILATDPSKTYTGTVRKVAMSAELHQEHGNSVLLTVDFNRKELPVLRPGAGVTAKVYCGQQSVGYVFFHDVVDFIYSQILFRL